MIFKNSIFVDYVAIVSYNLIYILMLGIFAFRKYNMLNQERILGIIIICMIIPFSYVALFNLISKKESWSFIIPCIILIFLVLELFLDYILNLNFRETKFVYIYVLIYYVSLMTGIGYSFLVNKKAGFITLIFYFINLIGTYILTGFKH